MLFILKFVVFIPTMAPVKGSAVHDKLAKGNSQLNILQLGDEGL